MLVSGSAFSHTRFSDPQAGCNVDSVAPRRQHKSRICFKETTGLGYIGLL